MNKFDMRISNDDECVWLDDELGLFIESDNAELTKNAALSLSVFNELLESLECMVILYGEDDSYDGGLLPPDAQEETVATAMRLVHKIKGERNDVVVGSLMICVK